MAQQGTPCRNSACPSLLLAMSCSVSACEQNSVLQLRLQHALAPLAIRPGCTALALAPAGQTSWKRAPVVTRLLPWPDGTRWCQRSTWRGGARARRHAARCRKGWYGSALVKGRHSFWFLPGVQTGTGEGRRRGSTAPRRRQFRLDARDLQTRRECVLRSSSPAAIEAPLVLYNRRLHLRSPMSALSTCIHGCGSPTGSSTLTPAQMHVCTNACMLCTGPNQC
jgi:hypothetical protein